VLFYSRTTGQPSLPSAKPQPGGRLRWLSSASYTIAGLNLMRYISAKARIHRIALLTSNSVSDHGSVRSFINYLNFFSNVELTYLFGDFS